MDNSSRSQTNIVNKSIMENREQQILSEIKSMVSSIKSQLEQLDAKIAEFQQEISPDEIDLSPMFELSESVPDSLDELPVSDESVFISEPEILENQIDEDKTISGNSAVIDVMTSKQAWRTDMPGSSVKDVRGAIALVDRVLFINSLFGTDPMAFQDTLTRINQLENLDEAVSYLMSAHPEWDFDSEVVYRFMMAVRRKVNR